MTGPALSGTVAEFDEAVGWGTLRDAGGVSYGFHCTQIAGGVRTIAIGTEVTFTLAPAHLGTYEARGLTPGAPRS